MIPLLLTTLLALGPQATPDQRVPVAEGTTIAAVDVSGFDIERLSPGLEDFPLRMLSPYRTISVEEADVAARLLRENFPDCA